MALYIILDDGGHTAEVITSLRTLYPCVREGGYYTLEDVCTMGFVDRPNTTLFENKSVAQHVGEIYESIHYYWGDYLHRGYGCV